MNKGRDGFVPNPILSGLVGICPLIVVSRSLAEGAVYGLGAALCALTLGVIVPPVRAMIADRLHASATLVFSAPSPLSTVSALSASIRAICSGPWIYLPLIAVSGLSLSTLRRSPLSTDLAPTADLDSRMLHFEALMFLLTAAFVGGAREIIGLGRSPCPLPGSCRFASWFPVLPLRILVSPAGGFVFLGFLVAAYRAVVRAGGRRQP